MYLFVDQDIASWQQGLSGRQNGASQESWGYESAYCGYNVTISLRKLTVVSPRWGNIFKRKRSEVNWAILWVGLEVILYNTIETVDYRLKTHKKKLQGQCYWCLKIWDTYFSCYEIWVFSVHTEQSSFFFQWFRGQCKCIKWFHWITLMFSYANKYHGCGAMKSCSAKYNYEAWPSVIERAICACILEAINGKRKNRYCYLDILRMQCEISAKRSSTGEQHGSRPA